MRQLDELRLGEDDEVRRLDGVAELTAVGDALAQQARRSLLLLSRDMEARLYDREPFLEAVKQLATSGRQARIQVLLADPTGAVRQGHRLIELARRLSSFIEIRRLGPDHQDLNEAFLVADETGFVRRDSATSLAGAANFADRGRARELAELFADAWNYAQPDPELRRLHL